MDIVTVKPNASFELDLQYADGSMRRFDMKPLLAIKPWSKIASLPLFMQAKAAYGTVVWPNEIDVAPETLWMDSVEMQHDASLMQTPSRVGFSPPSLHLSKPLVG